MDLREGPRIIFLLIGGCPNGFDVRFPGLASSGTKRNERLGDFHQRERDQNPYYKTIRPPTSEKF
jgi:hypothetical protein